MFFIFSNLLVFIWVFWASRFANKKAVALSATAFLWLASGYPRFQCFGSHRGLCPLVCTRTARGLRLRRAPRAATIPLARAFGAPVAVTV
jgi:hypothetical protein